MLRQVLVDPHKVAAYIRWSTEDQGEGHTLELQRDYCQRVFRDHNWVWNESLVYVDAGISGSTLDRPAMTQLRRDVLQRRVDCVVVYRLDRISRKTVDTLTVVQVEWENLCHLVSATEPISTLHGMAEIVLPIMSTVGEMDRNRIISNTKAGRYAAVRKGRNVGKPPYGYQLGSQTGEIDVCEAEAAMVKRIFREYLSGSGLTTVCAMLNQEAIPSPQGMTWSPNSVGLVLKNEAYVGRLVYARQVVNPRRRRHKDEKRYLKNEDPIVVENVFPRLVSDEDFRTAQQVRSRRANKHKGRRTLNSQYLLTGVTRCAKCGYSVVGITNSQGYRYYACQGKLRRRSGCDSKLFRAEELDATVLPRVRREFSAASRDQLVESMVHQRNERLSEVRTFVHTVEAELTKIRGAKKRWLEAFEQGTIAPAIVNDRVHELRTLESTKHAALESAVQSLSLLDRQSQDGRSMEALLNTVGAIDVWGTLTFEQQKYLLQCFLRDVQVYASPYGGKQVAIALYTATIPGEPPPPTVGGHNERKSG